MLEVLVALLAISVVSNVFQYYLLGKQKKSKQLTTDAKEVLRDLLNGETLLKIEVVDKSSIFLRSPRDL